MNAIVWILWLTATMTFTLTTRNPLYIMIVLGGLFGLGNRLAKERNMTPWVLPNLRFLLTMILLSTLINGLFSHVGNTALFSIPQSWPLIGGDITLESLIYGVINGLVIGTLYILFNTINLALSTKQITRLIPHAFHPIAVVITIALTFFPSIQQRAREIKEAQMIRGNPMKKISDWIPIMIPLLVSSLENAILLAESMTARGFHKQTELQSPRALVSLILAAFMIFSGWILQMYRFPSLFFISLYILGTSLVTITLLTIGKQANVTRYHQETWTKTSMFSAALIGIYIAGFAFLALIGRLSTLGFSPYPRLHLPAIQTLGLIFSLIPLLPILVLHHD
ncbi:MAG: energy-coupling factor transporter transmembrane protein EcfT [Brevefilum sp.]|nr:energy-coupling factor transporter transmembrane protein EcfT [Brevefilum sp.]